MIIMMICMMIIMMLIITVIIIVPVIEKMEKVCRLILADSCDRLSLRLLPC